MDVAARSRLTDILGARYTIDPGASGTISMATGGPVPRDQLLMLFEAALKAAGLVRVKQGDAVLIQPGGNGVTASLASAGFGLTAVPLHHPGAKRMLAPLNGFEVPPGTIRAAMVADVGMGGGSDVRFSPNDGDKSIIIRAANPIRNPALSRLALLDKAPARC